MEARFIGDPSNDCDGPRVLTLFGVTFPKNRWTDVSGLESAYIAKLEGNRHFQTRESGSTDEPPLPETSTDEDETPQAPAEPPAIEATGSKAEIIEQLKALGAEYDARWGVPRLAQTLEQARFLKGDDE